ncbi:methionyl-tRNA formyltransferase [Dysgonomonadaceae bacterium zrk40]|nr:methionyl-tRNA formyltransferase [Dysgonomonadaceae bacterium zrk40]
MTKKSLRIVFMGTPEFAVESLKAIVEAGYNVVGVITMPDKAVGRGYKLQPSAVKQYALGKGLTILQPASLKDSLFLEELKALRADLQVVVAFRMLPEVVWNMPPLGTFNLHASLLPQYRGAAPINWALINGEQETGVTTFFLSHEIDTGRIIFREKTAIGEEDNAGTLHDRLMVMGAKLVTRTIDAIVEGNVSTLLQSELIEEGALLKSAPKIFSETCRVNWNRTATEVCNLIRGLSPYPAAWTEMTSKEGEEPYRIKLFAAEKVVEQHTLPAGTICTDNKSQLEVAVADGFVRITELQLQGKKRMQTAVFMNGFSFPEDAAFA